MPPSTKGLHQAALTSPLPLGDVIGIANDNSGLCQNASAGKKSFSFDFIIKKHLLDLRLASCIGLHLFHL